MAKNWKCNEAVRAIQSGDKAAIQDIGRRFPLFANLAAQVNEAGAAILDCVPEYCTARKIESVLKGDVPEVEEETEVEEVEEEKAPAKKSPAKKPAKKAPAKKEVEEEADDEDLESKSAKELYEMCKEKGLKVKAKQDKAVYIEALTATEAEDEEDWEEEKPAPKKAAKKPAKKAKEEDDEDDDWDI